MSNNKPVELTAESKKALETQAIKSKVDELTNLNRLVFNTLNLICSNDVQIPSAYAKPVAEIQQWLEGMHKGVQTQIDTLRPMLPAEDQKEVPQVIKPELEVVEAKSSKKSK